jgi:large subunit ribosomal protein L21
MYAIIEDGSRQYRVSEGDLVVLDYRDGAEKGTRLELGHVLLYQNGTDTQIGRPLVEGARVVAEVVEHTSKKVTIQKFRRRKNYRRFKGHRQWHTKVRVKYILLAGQEPTAAPQPSAEAPAPQTPPVEVPQQTPPPPAQEQPAPAPQPQAEAPQSQSEQPPASEQSPQDQG